MRKRMNYMRVEKRHHEGGILRYFVKEMLLLSVADLKGAYGATAHGSRFSEAASF